MYLKSIEVQGFKSFANKITFQFHPGITGIVGPNGSGKSNVGDAVRWVLGEQSAKQLRGANMQDVIFSGTENRKPLGFASVAITLDNGDHQLPTDYGEVTVTRRVYRSGESEYLINGRSCRLKDINELFYDTGIGKEGYSIIGQGQIDKILSGRPEERRELFDEAAGIVKFKRRKLAAQKKLEDEQGNLVRVNDILSELTKQLAPLERQAETAKLYLKKRDELKVYDANLFLIELQDFKEKLKDVQEKLAIAKNDLEETKSAYEETKAEYEKNEAQIEELDRKAAGEQEAAGQSALKCQQLEGQIQVLKEQIHTGSMNEEHLKNRLEAVARDLETRRSQESGAVQELDALKGELLDIEDRQENARLDADASAAALAHLEKEINAAKNEVIELLNKRSATNARMERFDTMLEQHQIRRASLNQQILQIKSEESVHADTLARREKDLEEITRSIEKLSGEAAGYEAETEKIRQKMIIQNQQIETGQTAYHREASRLETLRNITERYDGYGNSIRRVMEQRTKEKGLLGVVADLIKTEKAYETAIETALGGSIQNIVTEDEDTAKRMIAYLKQNKFGRATFLPLTSITSRSGQEEKALNEPGVVGLASRLVQAEKKYSGLVRYLLGRVLVVDEIDHALAIARKYKYSLRIVTLEGESLSPGGSMTGGSFKNASNLLGRRREIEELSESVTMLKKELDEARRAMEENRVKRSRFREQIVAVNEKLQDMYLKQNTVKLEISQLKERGAETKSTWENLRKEADEIDSQAEQLRGEKTSVGEKLKESIERQQELESFTASRQKELESERAVADEQSARMEEFRLQMANAKQKEEFLSQNLQRIREELKALLEEQGHIQSGIAANSDETRGKQQSIELLSEEVEKEKENGQKAQEKAGALRSEREQCAAKNKAFFNHREELSQRMNMLDKECFRLDSQCEKLEEGKEKRINEIWEAYELTSSSAAQLKNPEYTDTAQMKKVIRVLKEEIRSLGNVNVNAIEDYREVSERHTFLAAQQEDLVKAKKALEDIITELDEGMRRQFTEKFAQIQTEFNKVFQELFGGGKGGLELVEDEDILEAGIRIISQPPGKKLQNMMQLSGGEKALTAIALLFAIQNLKPSPFCLLDEIEAALDESNVTRYANYLHKLTKNTQFIIITHRRGTMAVADRLYGITMQEKGVSALVSVNLIEEDLK